MLEMFAVALALGMLGGNSEAPQSYGAHPGRSGKSSGGRQNRRRGRESGRKEGRNGPEPEQEESGGGEGGVPTDDDPFEKAMEQIDLDFRLMSIADEVENDMVGDEVFQRIEEWEPNEDPDADLEDSEEVDDEDADVADEDDEED